MEADAERAREAEAAWVDMERLEGGVARSVGRLEDAILWARIARRVVGALEDAGERGDVPGWQTICYRSGRC